MRTALQDHGSLSRGVFAVAVLVSLVVLFAPGDGVPSALFGVDKLVHVTLFAALALSGRWAGIRRSVLGVLLVLYGAVSEVLQALTPVNRSASVADWLADVSGLLLGLVVWTLLARKRARAH